MNGKCKAWGRRDYESSIILEDYIKEVRGEGT